MGAGNSSARHARNKGEVRNDRLGRRALCVARGIKIQDLPIDL